MDGKKVTDYQFLIKIIADAEESLLEYQAKFEAMIEIVLERDLIDYPALKLHVYIRELNDSIDRSLRLTEDLTSALNRIISLLMNSGTGVTILS